MATTSAVIQDSLTHVCDHCGRGFAKESSLMVHVCEHKRRHQERNEVGVQLGLQCYLRFYEITQGSAKLKSWDDFVKSPYYRAFVKFGRYCQSIRAINSARFADWLIKHNKKIDYWCKDSLYNEYLLEYLKQESAVDALIRAIQHSQDWEADTGNVSHDYLRFGNDNLICYAINIGKISPWALYNSQSGLEFLSRINSEQLAMIWPYIDSDFWAKKFSDYTADVEYAKDILAKAGW